MARQPQQERAKATVEAIIGAGIIVLARDGSNGLTTRKVADTAGVSVGSLYEYFEDKKAIQEAIIDSLARQISDAIRPEIKNIVRLPMRDAVFNILSLVKKLLEKDDERVLHCIRNSMEHLRSYPFKPLQKVLSELSIQYLMHHPEIATIKNLPTASYIVIHGGMYTVIHHMADKNPPISFDEMAGGLADMISAYTEANLATNP